MPLHLSCLPTKLAPPHLHNTSVFLVYHVNNVCLPHPGSCSTWSGRVPPAAVYRGVGQQLLKLLLGNQTIVSRLLQAVCSLSVCSAAQRVNSKQQTAYSPLQTCESFVSSGKPLSLFLSHTHTIPQRFPRRTEGALARSDACIGYNKQTAGYIVQGSSVRGLSRVARNPAVVGEWQVN